jgi:hypothetical protein
MKVLKLLATLTLLHTDICARDEAMKIRHTAIQETD